MLRSFLFIAFLFSLLSCKGQQNHPKKYSDALIIENELWGLATDGTIRIFNMGDSSIIIRESNTLKSLVAFTKDHNGNVLVADSSNRIQSIDPKTFKAQIIGKCDTGVYALICDSRNNCYAITGKGIVDVGGHHTYMPAYFQRRSFLHHAGSMDNPSAYFMDKSDQLWVAFDFGEWGSNLQVFDTKSKTYLNLEGKHMGRGMYSPRSIFENGDDIYMTTSLMHFDVSSSVLRITQFTGTVIFESEMTSFDKNMKVIGRVAESEYIGAGAYNRFDDCIYFYSQHGIFKGDPKHDLSKIENWQKILQPKLLWTNGQSKAVGAQMNVTKLQFIDKNKFFFVSQNNGIGLFDGTKLVMLQ